MPNEPIKITVAKGQVKGLEKLPNAVRRRIEDYVLSTGVCSKKNKGKFILFFSAQAAKATNALRLALEGSSLLDHQAHSHNLRWQVYRAILRSALSDKEVYTHAGQLNLVLQANQFICELNRTAQTAAILYQQVVEVFETALHGANTQDLTEPPEILTEAKNLWDVFRLFKIRPPRRFKINAPSKRQPKKK